MKKYFTEEQIIGVLKGADAGAKVAELCRKYGISDATYYNWKAKFGGMTVSEARRLKALGIRERKAEAVVSGINAGQCCLEGSRWPKVVGPQERRVAITHMMTAHGLGVTRA